MQPDIPGLGPVRGPSEGLSQVAALLEALERLLTAPFPTPVPLPAGGLLLMLTRILSMDDVVHSSGAFDDLIAVGVQAFWPEAILLMFRAPVHDAG